MRVSVFLVSYPLSLGKGAGGIGRQMTRQLVSLFETNYVCLTTLSVLHMPYQLTRCLHTFLPIPRLAGGPFPKGRGFAIRDNPFLKIRGASDFYAPHHHFAFLISNFSLK